MSTSGRRHSPAVYRRRRIVLLLVVLLIAAGVTLAIWQPWTALGESDPDTAPSPSDTPTAASSTPPESSTPPVSPTPTTPPPSPTPTESPEPLEACATAFVDVEAETDKEFYGPGELPQLSITLTNRGDVDCLINVGTAAQSFVITSGSDTWWRSTDCQTESSDQVVKLAAGSSVSSVEPLEWDRTRSAVDTCDDDRQNAGAGYYNLIVTIGGLEALAPAQFVLG